MIDSTFYLKYIKSNEQENVPLNNIKQNKKYLSIQFEENGPSSQSLLYLYISHFIQTFGDRMWSFAVPLLFTELFPGSLLPQALYKGGNYLSRMLLLPLLGSYIHKTNRLKWITTTIIIQNICVVLSCIIMFILADNYHTIIVGHMSLNTISFKLIFIFILLLFSQQMGDLFGQGATISLERDWCPVLCRGNDKLLSSVNAKMKRIDLICQLGSPAIFGIYMQFIPNDHIKRVYYGILLIFVWNVIGMGLEWKSVKACYKHNYFRLSKEKQSSNGNLTKNPLKVIYFGWREYIKSPILFPSFASNLMYMNSSSLSGGVVCSAYLRFRGISYLILGISKGFSAISGIIGTFITPFMIQKMDLKVELVGLFTYWLFWFFVIPIGIADIILGQSSHVLAWILLICIIFGRVGVRAHGLCQLQLTQMLVNDSVRVQVSGCQKSMGALFGLTANILAIAYHRIDQYFTIVWITEIVVFIGCIIYSIWYVLRNVGYHLYVAM